MTLWWQFPVSGVETWLWLPPLLAAGISFFTSMLGISGAFLLVPVQMSLFGFASPSASATNLVFNLIAIPGGMRRYQREGRLLWALALTIAAGGAPGALAGAWLRTHALAERGHFEPFVAAVLLYLAWRMLAVLGTDSRRGAACEIGTLTLVTWGPREIRFIQGGIEYRVGVPALLGLSALVGAIGTAYGIGGGSFMVPLCLVWWRLPLHAIAGATLTATFLTSGVALAAYQWLPAPPGVVAAPDWLLGAAFGAGGLVGTYLGACCQKYVPQAPLKGLLGIILLGLAGRYLWPG